MYRLSSTLFNQVLCLITFFLNNIYSRYLRKFGKNERLLSYLRVAVFVAPFSIAIT